MSCARSTKRSAASSGADPQPLVLRAVFRNLFGNGRASRHVDSAAGARLAAAIAHERAGAYAQAETIYREMLRTAAENGDAQHLLGRVLNLQGRHTEAIAVLRPLVQRQPQAAEAHLSLAGALRACGSLAEAAATLQTVTDLRPDLALGWAMLGEVFNALGEIDRAEAAYRRALDLGPTLSEPWSNLGVNLMTQGRVGEAIAAYRKAISVNANAVGAHSNLVYALNFDTASPPEAVFEEHVRWAERHAAPLANVLPAPVNDRSASRRLRIGYVSPDFRRHSVGYFFEPVLAHHDRAALEVFCYSDVVKPDDYTERLKSYGATWRDITSLSDDATALAIRADSIDILVDLAGHTDRNRLLVFARKAAPVQVTWSGYINTTGMAAMDYRLTDGYMDPPGASEHLYSERLMRLPRIYTVFQPPEAAPAAGALPAQTRGYVTFACFNGRFKVSDEDIAAWAEILRRVPRSRLLLMPISEGKTRSALAAAFASHGIDSDRLDLRSGQRYDDYLALHQSIDIVLDTAHVHGVTTTSHSLWMGVPVVARAGNTSLSRAGVSLLMNAGLSELLADSRAAYIEIATALAQDLQRLADLRARLRPVMARAPNTDGASFSRELAAAYREMWRRWCSL